MTDSRAEIFSSREIHDLRGLLPPASFLSVKDDRLDGDALCKTVRDRQKVNIVIVVFRCYSRVLVDARGVRGHEINDDRRLVEHRG